MVVSYTKWLSATTDESERINHIETQITAKDTSKARALLKGLDIHTLVKFTELSKSIQAFCSQKEQNDLWESHLQRFGVYAISYQIYPPMTVSQTVKGIYYYWLAAEYRAETKSRFSENERDFLKKSAENHCFYAYNSLATWAYELSKVQFAEHATLAIGFAQEASQYHWTPGYLLLYKTYANLAILPNLSTKYYQLALEALFIAKILSTTPHSQSAINIAYFGKGIMEGNKSQMTSWEKAISDIIEKGKIPMLMVNQIYDNASNQSKKLLEKFGKDLKAEIEPDLEGVTVKY
jgi:hypothetical protein